MGSLQVESSKDWNALPGRFGRNENVIVIIIVVVVAAAASAIASIKHFCLSSYSIVGQSKQLKSLPFE